MPATADSSPTGGAGGRGSSPVPVRPRRPAAADRPAGLWPGVPKPRRADL